jgi:hypothetical protein
MQVTQLLVWQRAQQNLKAIIIGIRKRGHLWSSQKVQGMGPDTVARDALYLTTHSTISTPNWFLYPISAQVRSVFVTSAIGQIWVPTQTWDTWKAITSYIYKLDRSVCKYITNTQWLIWKIIFHFTVGSVFSFLFLWEKTKSFYPFLKQEYSVMNSLFY